MSRPLLLGVLLLVGAGGASAQDSVYRCGNEYTRVPCSQGRLVAIDDPEVTAPRRAEAARVAASEKRLAADMSRDRRLAEAAIRPAMAGSLSAPKVAAPEAKPSSKSKSKKKRGKASADEREDFVAVAPKPKK
ncbi:MAG: hypothetical protein ABI460_18945 [Caldimonas sp.]